MKKYLCLIISLLNAVATAIYIALIDKDIVPIHYDFYGNVDNEGSKWSFMFLPVILLYSQKIGVNKITLTKYSNLSLFVISDSPFLLNCICYLLAT